MNEWKLNSYYSICGFRNVLNMWPWHGSDDLVMVSRLLIGQYDMILASDWLMVTTVSGCQSSISAMAGITPELIDGAVWIFRQVLALSVASLHFIGVASKVEENVAAENIIQSCVLRSQDWKLISLNIPPLPPVNTPPGSTWLFSNEKNDFQILFKFATWPAPSSPPSPTLIPFPVSVCSFTAGADQVINEDIDGGSDVTTQFSGKWWWFALRRSEKRRFTFLQNLLDRPDTTWRNESNNNGSFRLSIASGRLSALTTMLMTLLTSIKLGFQLLEI